jgi:hypothetical protein
VWVTYAFGFAHYLLALRWQEKAERLQAQADAASSGNGPDADRARTRQEARDAWSSAAVCWGGYVHDNPLSLDRIQADAAATDHAHALARRRAQILRTARRRRQRHEGHDEEERSNSHHVRQCFSAAGPLARSGVTESPGPI